MKRIKREKTVTSMTPIARSNRFVMKAHFFNVFYMFIACVAQVIWGAMTSYYLVPAFLLAFLPDIISYIYWKKNPETPVIKHLTAIAFAAFYMMVLFTSHSPLIYLFCVPMILAYSVYSDLKGSILISIGVTLVNILAIYLDPNENLLGDEVPTQAMLQLVFIVFISIYSVYTSQTSSDNVDYMIANLTNLTNEMKQGIKDVHEELIKLNDASTSTANAMQEVTTGTNDTAEAVQSQLLQTQEIQNKVDMVSYSTEEIADHMRDTLHILEQGNQNVSSLIEKVDASVQSGVEVTEKLRILEESVTEMNSVVAFISNIAREVGLLALNARIEASHAGTAGKGFAVVASEIAEMANQTKEATTSIASLIEHTSSGITETVAVIHQMIDGIQEEKISTDRTADSFTSIQEGTLSVRDNIEVLTRHIQDLKEANSLIADSIQTISAVSEQVSAHAAETASAEEENTTILAKIDSRMQKLLEAMNQ